MEYSLEELFDLQMGKTPSRSVTDYWESGDNKWISIADLSKCGKYIYDTKECLSDSAITESGIKQIPANTVVMSFKLSIGKTAITSEPMYSNEAIMSFRDKKLVQLLPEYIYYLLLSKNWDDGTNKAVMGKTLNKATLSKVKVNIHSIQEQEEIVCVLNQAAALIELHQQQLQNLDELIKARFVEMFGDKTKFKAEPLRNNVEEMFIGPFGSALKNECFVDKDNAYCMVYEQKHAIRKTLDVPTRYVNAEKYNELKRFSVQGGDIIVSCRGTIGEIYSVPENAPLGIMHPSIMKIRLKKRKYCNLFFVIMLEQYMRESVNKANGSGVKMAVTATELGEEVFIVPEISLQLDFEQFVHQVDKSKSAVQKSLDEAQLLFDSLMQQYFG